jgi:hypothetical protein
MSGAVVHAQQTKKVFRIGYLSPLSTPGSTGSLEAFWQLNRPNVIELYRRAAVFLHKIVKGTKPADIPIEQPMKFEFIVNLKAAKWIGLTIPPNVLARADKVIR